MTAETLQPYPAPVAALAALGEPGGSHLSPASWPDYAALGIAAEHVDALLRMTEDAVLGGLGEKDTAVWAPYHASRALGQLRAVVAVPRLLRLIETFPGDDYLHQELSHVMAAIGPAAIADVAAFVGDDRIGRFSRIIGIECLEQIARVHADARADCVGRMVAMLAGHDGNHPTINGFLICSLVGLRAREAIEPIRAAYAADAVDWSVAGDLEDVEVDMGFRLFRATPRPHYNHFRDFGEDEDGDGHGGWPADRASDGADGSPAVNPYRNVGRNDPCPCGSGKKFKKCCLAQAR